MIETQKVVELVKTLVTATGKIQHVVEPFFDAERLTAASQKFFLGETLPKPSSGYVDLIRGDETIAKMVGIYTLLVEHANNPEITESALSAAVMAGIEIGKNLTTE